MLILVRARIAAATGLPPAVMELTKVHYSVGERFDLHFDYIDPAVPGFAGELAARGQHPATFLVYLNGLRRRETDFPASACVTAAKRAARCGFANVDAAGEWTPRRCMRGLRRPGAKWLLSQWIGDRAPA